MSEQLIPTPGVFGENGNFLLERELGTGGMGGVYMGRDKMLDRPVAVKVMLREYGADAEFVEKFKKEAQAAAKLIHPNIAQIYSYGICDGMPYIAMELVAGGSLYSIMSHSAGKTDVARVMKICQQVAQALQCANDLGYVHGDVKPENILLDANGNAKLVDFGLAAMQKDTDEIWGTPYYISPEKVKKEPVDFRADMYSLGGTLYHALTGVAPFEGEDSIAVVKARFAGMPKKPSEVRADLTPAIDQLVMKMLALNPEDRYPSFEALLEAFKEVLTNGLVAGAEAQPATRPTTGVKRMTTVRGIRRRTTLRKPGATTAVKPVERPVELDENGEPLPPVDEDVPNPETEEDEEESGGGSLVVKVILFVVGGLLAIGAVIGGLIWYKVSSDASERAAVEAQVRSQYAKAKDAVEDTVKKAVAFADEFDVFAQKAIEECEKPTAELAKLVDPEIAKQLRPASSKELDAAIAATNETPKVEAPAPAPAAATNAAPAAATNAAPAAVAAKDAKAAAPAPAKDAKAAAPAKDAKPAAAPAKDAKAAPAPAAKPAEEAKTEPPPEVVVKMHELWETAYSCRASAIRIRQMSREIVKKGAEAADYAEPTLENAQKLADLSQKLVEMLDQMKTGKDVENVRKSITLVKSKGKTIVEQTTKRLRIEKLEADRKAKAEAAAEAEKKRLEEQAEKRKAKVEEEEGAVATKFETIAAQGNFRQLDWKGAIRQLETLKAEMTTPEGELALELAIRKVNDMKKVQDVFVKSIKDHVFKGKLKGCKVTGVNEKEIQMTKPDGKTRGRISWQKFYKSYPGNLNELFLHYIVKGRKNAKPTLGLKDWADAMTGAALTMQLVCSEVNGAAEQAEKFAKEAVKEFPDYRKTAEAIFPDIKFEAAEE